MGLLAVLLSKIISGYLIRDISFNKSEIHIFILALSITCFLSLLTDFFYGFSDSLYLFILYCYFKH